MRAARCAVGLDIGGTAVKMGVVRADGAVTATSEIETPVLLQQERAIRQIAWAVAEMISQAGRDRAECGPVGAVGVGCAGLVNSAAGIVHTSPNLPLWKDAPLGAIMAAELGLRCVVVNDANAFTLAEARNGAAAGASPVVGITLGTGVGGAIVVGGRLFGGRHGFAGEVGHMSIDHAGPRCPCGNRGCVELYLGKRALVSAYMRDASWRPGGIVHDLAAGKQEAVDPKMLSIAAARGDRVAAEVFGRAGEMLGFALVNLANLIDPECFVIGGGVSQAGELLLGPARETLRRQAMMGAELSPAVRVAGLGMSAGLVGAALVALDAISTTEAT